ncbi:MAG: ATP-binding cassette domain-containing protein, partial [Candidatus Kapaibacteriota bacterium]
MNDNLLNRKPLIELKNISKVYLVGEEQVFALREINLTIYPNEYVAIMGPSGSGKSTLMNIIGCLDTPTTGEYILKG